MSRCAATIIDTFREAALGLCDWTDALAGLARAMDAPRAQLMGWNTDEALVINMTCGVDAETMARFIAEGGGAAAVNPRIGLGFGSPKDRFGTDASMLDPTRRDRWPIYRRLFDPFDAGNAAQTALSAPPGIALGLSVLRPRARPYDPADLGFADAAAPGIAAAVGAALTLGTHAQQCAVTTAEALRGAVVVLGDDRAVVSLSQAADDVVRDGRLLRMRSGRLAAVGAANDQLLDALLLGARVSDRRGEAVLRHPGGASLRIEVTPLGRRASGALSPGRVLLTIRGIDGSAVSCSHALTTRYGLTAAETEIALLLARGRTLRQIAAERGRSYDTVRAQVRSVFDKTGRHRQADLISLVREFG